MAKSSKQCDNISLYNEDFIKSISLSNVSDQKELRALLQKLERANYEITNFYSMVLQDYVSSINNNYEFANVVPSLSTVKKYKSIATKIQKAYNYVLYLVTFDNPFSK